MTVNELAKRVEALEAAIRDLKTQLATGQQPTRSWLDTYGKYADDPMADEAARLGREWREKINRESLEEFDREEAAAKAKEEAAAGAKKAKQRPKAKAGSKRGGNGRA